MRVRRRAKQSNTGYNAAIHLNARQLLYCRLVTAINLQEIIISTLLRRILHAILFEVGALVILVPLMSYGFGMDLFHFGALALILALCAMGCNMFYNHVFEWFEKRYGWIRTVPVRIGHTLGFEVCFMAVALPITAWWMHISVIDALMLDLVFSIFFMLYAFCFNWVYDVARRRLTMRAE